MNAPCVTTLSGAVGTVRFGEDGFVLHRFAPAAPEFTDGGTLPRRIRLEGYVLPPGETPAARREALSVRVRLLNRLAAERDGLLLRRGERTASVRCDAGPAFDCDPPFSAGEAASFVLNLTTDGDGCFRLPDKSASAQGRRPSAVFPATFAGGYVFGTLTRSGALRIENPGDAAAGFTARVTALGGALESFTLTLNGESLHIAREVPEGGTLTVCTVPGRKTVLADGLPALASVSPDSVFFPLPPGAHDLLWSSAGPAFPALSVTFSPLVL